MEVIWPAARWIDAREEGGCGKWLRRQQIPVYCSRHAGLSRILTNPANFILAMGKLLLDLMLNTHPDVINEKLNVVDLVRALRIYKIKHTHYS